MDNWIELENTHLTNQPLIARGRTRVPDPDFDPTEAWLFCYRCTLTPKRRRVRRKRYLHVVKAADSTELEAKIIQFAEREDVILISDQAHPGKYVASGEQPTSLAI